MIAIGTALLVGLLYLILSPTLTLVPNWLPLVLVAILLMPSLVAALFLRRRLPYHIARVLALGALAVLTATLITSVLLLIRNIPRETGAALLRDGSTLWAMNILVFAIWYWEIDSGGPIVRTRLELYSPMDFQFPQHQNGNVARWTPGFLDYLFLAFCFSTALSPADTAPVSHRTKSLLMVQAILAMTIIVLIVARSVNVLQ